MFDIVLDCTGSFYTNNCGYMSWWGFPFFGLWFIGIIIAIIFIFVYLIIQSGKTEEKEIMIDSQKIIDERYAKGEITRKEYLQIKEDIKNYKR